MQKSVLALIAISIVAMAGLASAQSTCSFGEYAGQIIRNISVGSSEMDYWVLSSSCNHTVEFYIVPQYFDNASGAPKVVYSASCTQNNLCTIPAGNDSYYFINLTISVPLNAPINKVWSGYADAYVPPVNASGSAQIQQGTAKLLQITTRASSTTTTSSTTSSSTSTTTIVPTTTTSTSTSTSTTTIIQILVENKSTSSTTTIMHSTSTICYTCYKNLTNKTKGINQNSSENSTTNIISGSNSLANPKSNSNIILVLIIASVISGIVAFLLLKNSGNNGLQ